MKSKLLFALIVIMLAGSACTSYDRCMRKFGQTVTDTAVVTVEYIIPRDSVVTHIHIDSIQYLIPGEVQEQKSDRATIRYWKDKYSNLLMMQADCDSVVIRDTLYLEIVKHEFYPPLPKQKKPSFALIAGLSIAAIIGLAVLFKTISK